MDKSLIKIIYKYRAELINEEKLLSKLKAIKDNYPQKEREEIEELISKIKELTIQYEKNSFLRFDKVIELLNRNSLYRKLEKDMTDEDILFMITDNIAVPCPMNLSQDGFDRLVEIAINLKKDVSENCWRLAMNYEYSGLNFEKIIDYLIEKRDIRYTVEMMWTIDDDVLNRDEVIDKIIRTKDKTFIKSILAIKDFTEDNLTEAQISKLESSSR